MTKLPKLWHIRISHYSEKARWALEHKGIEYRKMAPPPGAHMAVAGALTRGKTFTFPILQIDGDTVGDSSEIIAELERRVPERPLYPEDRAELRRALELEDHFDENLGPAIRRFSWHYLTEDPDLVGKAFADDLPTYLSNNRVASAGASRVAAGFVRMRYKARDDAGAQAAKQTVLKSLDRIEAELGDDEYLVGDTFSVADLTAAALFYPLVAPPEGPAQIERPPALEDFREQQSSRPGFQWIAGIFARHRNPVVVA
jgi:glutathione S-transferase